MGLKEQFEKYDMITDEDIARAIIYAWTLMVVADARVEQAELKALERFAKAHKLTQQFNQDSWLEDTVGEALNVYNTEGLESLLTVIKEQMGSSSIETKRLLLYSLTKLACVDGEFCDRELDLLNRIVELLGISKRDLLMISMLYATYNQTPF